MDKKISVEFSYSFECHNQKHNKIITHFRTVKKDNTVYFLTSLLFDCILYEWKIDIAMFFPSEPVIPQNVDSKLQFTYL